MKINRKLIERMSIEDFAERHNLIMEVHERNKRNMIDFNVRDAFYASFEGAEVKEGACLASEYGDGSNEEEAIRNYAALISGKLLVFNAFGRDRHEIQVPYLSYSK